MVWTASIARFRSTTDTARVFTTITYSAGTLGRFLSRKVQEHSPEMSGTFSIDIGGTSIRLRDSATGLYSITAIPFNVTASTL